MTLQKQEEIKILLETLANDYIKKSNNDNYEFRINQDDLKKIFDVYEKIKESVKPLISNEDFKQDRHKVASVFIFSIARNSFIKCIKFPQGMDREDLLKWVNLDFSIFFAFSLIFSFLGKRLERLKILSLPTTKENKSYRDYLRALLIHLTNVDFDDRVVLKNNVNAVSHILYLLEFIENS